jgi:hypothetical protein
MLMNDTRGRVWIDPFQTRLFFRVVIYWFVYTGTLFNLLFAWRLLSQGPGDLWQQFVGTLYDSVPLLICSLIVIPWIGLDAVRFTNRLVGPLHRFRKTIQSVTAHEPVAPIRLRRDDFLIEMHDDFNAMLAALEERGAAQTSRAAEDTASSRR